MDETLSLADTLKCLTMDDIKEALPHNTFSPTEKRSRAKLDEAVWKLSGAHHTVLGEAAESKKRRRLAKHPPPHDKITPTIRDMKDYTFFETVSEEVRRDRLIRFIQATGKEATSTASCAVCAGQFFCHELTDVKLTDLQSKDKLSPTKPHPAHILTEGMLLHRSPSAFRVSANGCEYVNMCTSCASDLRHNKTPALSLANGMWIGEVPLELRILTLPERILVARYFPAAYIVKLYPRKRGSRTWGSSSLQSGLRGNVSTYRLNTNDIVGMTDSQIMPPSSSILTATIGITFVGPGNLPEKTMPGFLRVNRNRVRQALQWLKDNNPIYKHIIISSERLNSLPVDGFPIEILSVVKMSNDTYLLAEEHDDYVPGDFDPG
jgi:hypothetical protein